MTPKTRKHVAHLKSAFKQVETVLVEWSDATRSKERALTHLENNRKALQNYVSTRNEQAIQAMPIPRVIGSNVIWNVR
jgi:exonuclease VII small subunit